MSIYFCTENYIKTNGIIRDNVDVQDFAPLIQFAAKAFVKRQIGSVFFDILLAKYNAQTLTANEEILVEYIQMCVAWRACAQSVLSLSFQLTNKGIQKQSDEYSESAEDKAIWNMYNHYLGQATYFETELRDYLITNKALYADFLSALNTDSSIKNNDCSNDGAGFNYGFGMFII